MKQLPARRWYRSPLTWLLALLVLGFCGALSYTPGLIQLENQTRDWRFRARGVQPLKASITIIAIDQKTLDSSAMARPMIFWGAEHARVFHMLSAAGASAIGFDLIQPVPLDGLLRDNPDQPEAVAIAAIPQLVLGFDRQLLPSGKSSETLPNQTLATALALGGGQLGLVNTTPDADGTVRGFVPADADGSLVFPLAVAAIASGTEAKVTSSEILLGKRQVSLNENGKLVIDYAGPDSTFPRISYCDLLAHPAAYASQIKDHICLIGTTSIELQDYHAVPFPSGGRRLGNIMAGVEVHANMVRTILSGHVSGAGAGVTALCLVLGAALAVPCCILPRISWGFVALVGVAAAWAAVCVLVFNTSGLQLPLVGVVLALLANGVLLSTLRWREESAQKRWIEDVFGRYVSPVVLDHFMRTPGAVDLGGSRQTITVLFSDIRGFTSKSDLMEPEQVTRFLNHYLEKMVDVVFEHGGTIDKYLGDGIMALWSWPVAQPDHALRAVRAAVQMQQQVEAAAAEWAELGVPSLAIGIGVHTGPAVLGNIGSPRRMERTAIGDTVNVASRLESLNKELGKSLNCNILISETTRDALLPALAEEKQTGFTLLPAGDTAIRGKHETMKIFAVSLENPGHGQKSAS